MRAQRPPRTIQPLLSYARIKCSHDPHRGEEWPLLDRPRSALCRKCHGREARHVVHAPVAAGSCETCHVIAHAGTLPKLLKRPLPGLCFDCHDEIGSSTFVHGAVRLGDCTVCHEPHDSDHPALLRHAEGKELCFLCHADDVTGRRSVHGPIAEGRCTACHDPHGSAEPNSLVDGSGAGGCLSCHDDPKRRAPCDPVRERCDAPRANPRFAHPPLRRYGCVACHDPHGSANGVLLLKPVNTLCQSCHAEQTDGAHVSSFAEGGHPVTGRPDPHRPERELSCASCHDPHGSDSPKLLRFGESPLDSCDWCHGDRTGRHPGLEDISKKGRARP